MAKKPLNKIPSASQGNPSFELLGVGVQETPKTIQVFSVPFPDLEGNTLLLMIVHTLDTNLRGIELDLISKSPP